MVQSAIARCRKAANWAGNLKFYNNRVLCGYCTILKLSIQENRIFSNPIFQKIYTFLLVNAISAGSQPGQVNRTVIVPASSVLRTAAMTLPSYTAQVSA